MHIGLACEASVRPGENGIFTFVSGFFRGFLNGTSAAQNDQVR